MGKKKDAKLQDMQSAIGDLDVDDTDSRPEASPYTGKYINVSFGNDGTAFKVPESLLLRGSKLLPGLGINKDYEYGCGSYNRRLDGVPQGIDHVLVHHLFTGAYQCLKPTGPTPRDKEIAEYTTAIQYYVTARAYELNTLAEQAQSEIERIGARLDLHTIFRAAEKAYPNPCMDDAWFINYLKARSKALMTDQAARQNMGFRHDTQGTISVAAIFLESVVESLSSNTHLPPVASRESVVQETGACVGPLSV
ncbi:hypothetical protein CDD83_6269 [Cordyceps sp. RAO-2017]|nr:hypothetical protein CDD83_6269 [Cordyceps sp. RAO-2017]